ncbi:MobA-like NTP transferase domain protein [Leptospira inadai serovar Lyme str. 10]|uniref:MobA-like NTP transferase domain protein n=2 Tax=Leptospira inadai serovar Lyme TaxID=293084 RepID=V6HAN3_9LEPT|nr:molybdenum cofactor guanylyltransferase [Leptospira inadai]EQA36511.1 MobA-like NTP transferase domain protein [Leptospira inadai serovar Lyme str. 10]PNV75707.1 molybdenum cofactor guanylyltransferase [Leptospira inadai serovar Lyme]
MATNIDSVGVVLAGGFSSRMGRDKGLLPVGTGKYFLTKCLRRLSFLCIRTLVSVRSDQISEYSAFVSKENLVCDLPFSFGGPLAGLLSVFAFCRENHIRSPLLTLPVDMPFVRVRSLARIKEAGELASQGAFYCVKGELEPICGLFPYSYLEDWMREWEEGSLSETSPKSKLKDRNSVLLDLPEPEEKFFKNINFPSEYIRIQ